MKSPGSCAPRRRPSRRAPTNATGRALRSFVPYMVRKDDMMGCKNVRCRKRFELAGVQSVAFIE
jgi:hypothetical protein